MSGNISQQPDNNRYVYIAANMVEKKVRYNIDH